jgi:hypothetical protein
VLDPGDEGATILRERCKYFAGWHGVISQETWVFTTQFSLSDDVFKTLQHFSLTYQSFIWHTFILIIIITYYFLFLVIAFSLAQNGSNHPPFSFNFILFFTCLSHPRFIICSWWDKLNVIETHTTFCFNLTCEASKSLEDLWLYLCDESQRWYTLISWVIYWSCTPSGGLVKC